MTRGKKTLGLVVGRSGDIRIPAYLLIDVIVPVIKDNPDHQLRVRWKYITHMLPSPLKFEAHEHGQYKSRRTFENYWIVNVIVYGVQGSEREKSYEKENGN